MNQMQRLVSHPWSAVKIFTTKIKIVQCLIIVKVSLKDNIHTLAE